MKERFKGEEWLKVSRLPSVIFSAVALADGRADHNEESRFLEQITQSSTVDPLLREVYDRLFEQGNDVLRLSEYEKNHAAYLAEVRSILEERLTPDERRSFLAGLLGLGHNVAAASGGFFGLGNKVSAAESQRLGELTDALGLRELL